VGYENVAIFDQKITCYISETVEDRSYIQQGVLQALNPLSNRVIFTAIVSGAFRGGQHVQNNVLKWRTSGLIG